MKHFPEGREYDLEYICANPIPARCKKCKREFTDGQAAPITQYIDGALRTKVVICNEAIRAPDLKGCRCFYCGGELGPYEKGGPTTVEQVEQAKSKAAPQPMLSLY